MRPKKGAGANAIGARPQRAIRRQYAALRGHPGRGDRRQMKSTIQEDLVSLYLRLNGFFVTRFIVHSPIHGENRTELDALALRLPFSSEPERKVGPDTLLDLSEKHTDLALCEVKSKGQAFQFNRALFAEPAAVATVLRWTGLFEVQEIDGLAAAVADALKPIDPARSEPPTVIGPRGIRIRGLLFSPEASSRRKNQPWFVTGPDVLRYVWTCLCPSTPRSSCATTYDFRLWGDHERIVRYFKSRSTKGPGDIDALYAFLERSR